MDVSLGGDAGLSVSLMAGANSAERAPALSVEDPTTPEKNTERRLWKLTGAAPQVVKLLTNRGHRLLAF
jgi:hypothetical protein